MNDYIKHVSSELADYSLGLLPEDHRRQIDAHLQICESCRKELKIHRDLARSIQQTIEAATTPDPNRLAVLQPDFSIARRVATGKQTIRTQVVVVAAFLLLLLVGIGLQMDHTQESFMRKSPTISSNTATSTEVPTLTQIATEVPDEPFKLLDRTLETRKNDFSARPAVVPIPIAPYQ